jgi:hypothetical protein
MEAETPCRRGVCECWIKQCWIEGSPSRGYEEHCLLELHGVTSQKIVLFE